VGMCLRIFISNIYLQTTVHTPTQAQAQAQAQIHTGQNMDTDLAVLVASEAVAALRVYLHMLVCSFLVAGLQSVPLVAPHIDLERQTGAISVGYTADLKLVSPYSEPFFAYFSAPPSSGRSSWLPFA
jgi:hypothetical protein